jgi:drug/metabolite transporter (DMT)-like permease
MKHKLLRFWKPLLAVILWGMSFIATKIALKELNPESIILLRLLLAIILLLSVALYTKRDFSIVLKNHLAIFILAFIAVFHLWIQITGLKFTSATNTGWIIGVTPVIMAILGYIIFKEKITSINVFGIVIAFTGIMLLMSKGFIFNIGFISNKGDFLVLASAFTWSIYSILNKKISIGYSPFMTILFLFIMMTILIIPFTLNNGTINSVMHLSLRGWIAIFFLGILCSGIAYVLWAQALKELEATKVGVFLYFEPFVTVFTAWFLLGEVITIITIFSGIIITSGVILVNKKNSNY